MVYAIFMEFLKLEEGGGGVKQKTTHSALFFYKQKAMLFLLRFYIQKVGHFASHLYIQKTMQFALRFISKIYRIAYSDT